jgi:hypothetical protein
MLADRFQRLLRKPDCIEDDASKPELLIDEPDPPRFDRLDVVRGGHGTRTGSRAGARSGAGCVGSRLGTGSRSGSTMIFRFGLPISIAVESDRDDGADVIPEGRFGLEGKARPLTRSG